MMLDVFIFLGAVIMLIVSGSFMIKYLSKIAYFLRMSEYTVGFILLAFATSLPEVFVGISSALNKTPEIILGTVVGSNIANLTIVIGIPVLLARGITIHSKKTKTDAYWMIGMAAFPLLLMVIGNRISRIDAVFLLFAFSAYTYKLLLEGRYFSKQLGDHISRKSMVASVFLFVISLGVLYLSSDLVVEYASVLAIELMIPPIFIGMFLVAVGTSLPELVSGISAVRKGHNEMGVGNIIGSVIANSTFVLGISALIYPITADFLIFILSISFMVVVSIVFSSFVEKGDRLSWMDGLSLVLLYVFFLIVEFYAKGFALI